MSLTANSKITYEAGTMVVNTNYAGAADDPARVQLLIDLVSADSVDGSNLLDRLWLDEMTQIARVSLVAHLIKMKAAVS